VIQIKVGIVAIGVLALAIVVSGIVLNDMLRDDPPEAAATRAGDRPHPFQTASPSSSGESPGDEAADASAEGDGSATPDEDGTTSAVPDCGGVELGIGEYLPVYAIGEVTGMGPSARYVVFEECSGPAAYEVVYGSAPSTQEIAVEGGCSFLYTLGEKPDWFMATFRASPTDYLGVAEDDVNGVVTGGYSVGGDGSRGSGQQWSISGGRLEFEIEQLADVDGDGFVVLALSELTWEWSGESIENWTGEEAVGNVRVSCGTIFGMDPS
jgi:hypothetical protein